MAAAASDLFRKVARRFVSQVGAGAIGDDSTTTGPLASTTNLPTDTAVDITFSRVDSDGTATPSLEETVTGVVSGTNLVNMIRGQEGTAQAQAAGAVAENLLNAITWNDLIDGILAQHGQTGAHTNITASTIAASTVSASAVAATAGMTASHITASQVTSTAGLSGATLAVTSGISASSLTASAVVATGSVSTGTAAVTTNLTASSVGRSTASTALAMSTAWYQPFQSYTPSGGATATLDLSLGNDHVIAMPAGNITIAVVNGTVGQKFMVSILQDGGGSRTVTWFSTIRWAGGSAPTLTTTGSKRDQFGFKITGAGTYDGFVVGQNI